MFAALRRKLSVTLIFNLKISNLHRCYMPIRRDTKTIKRVKRDEKVHNDRLKKMRPLIIKRMQESAKNYPVKKMIPMARKVLKSRAVLYHGVSSLIKHFPISVCKLCSEVYIGEEGHLIKSCPSVEDPRIYQLHKWAVGGLSDILVQVDAFHLKTMFQRAIKHSERFDYDRIPAVLELCFQAGVKYSIPNRSLFSNKTNTEVSDTNTMSSLDLKILAETTLEAWETYRGCVKKLLLYYPTKVCENCLEVHVGPFGNLARNCGIFKFQRHRGEEHVWKNAQMKHLVPLKIVWRRRRQDPPVLLNEFKVFYGKAPAVIDLCTKAGADAPLKYEQMMKNRGLARPFDLR